MVGSSEQGAAVDRLYDALNRGDLEGAMECFTEDGKIWYSFDGIAQEWQSVRDSFNDLINNFELREVHDVRRLPIPGGVVQRHVMVAGLPGGKRIAWPVCIFVSIEKDKIARIDEYIDRAGSYEPPAQGPITIPNA